MTMNIRLRRFCSLLIAAIIGPSLFAASGAPLLNPNAPLLVKVNFSVEWGANTVPAQYNIAPILSRETPVKLRRYDTSIRMGFAQLLVAVFQKHGYKCNIKLIEDATEADRGKPILIIDLKRWATTDSSQTMAASAGAFARSGASNSLAMTTGSRRFDLQFDARLVTPKGNAALGTHEYTDIGLMSDYVKGVDKGLAKAVDEAFAQFYAKLDKAQMLAPSSVQR